MKKLLNFLFASSLIILMGSCGPSYVTVQETPRRELPPPPQPINNEGVSYQTFYDGLSPYGQWIDYPNYGYVWSPNVGPDFKPYATNGHWVYSEDGWVWASDYNWGWATFHYGRWFYENGYGWLWVPGYEWAPAWVSWRRSDDYYGWAPLSPGISIGISISNYNPPTNYWCFVPHQYVTSRAVNNYYVGESNNVTIINRTTVINNNVTYNNVVNNNTTINNTTINNNVNNKFYAAGPNPNEVSKFTGTSIKPVPITNSNKPGQQVNDGQIALYRPKVNNPSNSNVNNGNNQQPIAPSRVQQWNNIKPQQTGNNQGGQQGNSGRTWNNNNNPSGNGAANSNNNNNSPATNGAQPANGNRTWTNNNNPSNSGGTNTSSSVPTNNGNQTSNGDRTPNNNTSNNTGVNTNNSTPANNGGQPASGNRTWNNNNRNPSTGSPNGANTGANPNNANTPANGNGQPNNQRGNYNQPSTNNPATINKPPTNPSPFERNRQVALPAQNIPKAQPVQQTKPQPKQVLTKPPVNNNKPAEKPKDEKHQQ